MYPKAKTITLISDNFGTHTLVAYYETFPLEKAKQLIDRFEFINISKHGKLVEYGRDRIAQFKHSMFKWTYRHNGRNAGRSLGLADRKK